MKLYTIAEVAEILRYSRKTLYRWARAGTLPAVRVGGQLRVPASAVDKILQEVDDGHQAEPTGQAEQSSK